MARMVSITVGSTLSHYRILDSLGRGGMGEVWKAENIRLKKIVAIKTLSPQLLADEDAKARFLREARLAAKLDHPNIATVYDIGETEDLIFIVMEYVQGESLDKQIQCGPMSKREAVEIIVQVCEALSEAHKHHQTVEELLRDLRNLPVLVEVKPVELLPTKVVPETLPLPALPRLVPTLAEAAIALDCATTAKVAYN